MQLAFHKKKYRSDVGLPLPGGCVVRIDRKLWVQAHRYVLENTNEVQPYIMLVTISFILYILVIFSVIVIIILISSLIS